MNSLIVGCLSDPPLSNGAVSFYDDTQVAFSNTPDLSFLYGADSLGVYDDTQVAFSNTFNPPLPNRANSYFAPPSDPPGAFTTVHDLLLANGATSFSAAVPESAAAAAAPAAPQRASSEREPVEVTAEKVYKCTKCANGHPYKTKAAYDNHMNSVHKGVKEECLECGKKFSARSLVLHRLRSHPQKPLLHCPQGECRLKFALRGDLHHHIRRVHPEIEVPPPRKRSYKATRL